MRFKLYFSSLFCILLLCGSVSVFSLEVREVGSERKLIISDALQKALKDNHPNYRLALKSDFVPFVYDMYESSFPSNAAPFATFGDFNKDGSKDAVLMMIENNQKDIIYVSILSTTEANKKLVQKFYKDSFDKEGGNFLYLTTAPAEQLIFKKVTAGRKLSPRPGVRVNVWGVGAPALTFCYVDKQAKMRDCAPYLEN